MAYAAGAGAAGTALAPVAPVEIEYPSSNGEPLAESYFQLIPLFYAFDALRRRYAHRDDVFVAADLMIYYRRRTTKSVAPDVFVVFGAENRPRHDEAAARRQAEARIAALEALLRARDADDTSSG